LQASGEFSKGHKMEQQRVFVSGCFDLIHSGHLQFLQQAASFGQLTVALGSDQTIQELKGHPPSYTEAERLFLIRGLGCVQHAVISRGSGHLDFEAELRELRPDLLIVNRDGDSAEKRMLCQTLGVEYLVLERVPREGLPVRSTTKLRHSMALPYRMDLAGGWLDQPFVSSLYPGPVIVVSLHAQAAYHGRSGLATSTRQAAEALWGQRPPVTETPEQLARLLFAIENHPGTVNISGSQDALGIALPGLSYLHYAGAYWPAQIVSCRQPEVLAWLAQHVSIRHFPEREENYQVLAETRLSVSGAKALAEAAGRCWEAVLAQDLSRFVTALHDSFRAQIEMFPRMLTTTMNAAIAALPPEVLGWKIAGAGGGGYLVAVAENPPPGFEKLLIRNEDY
jgi:cytidyltransferase-like protein